MPKALILAKTQPILGSSCVCFLAHSLPSISVRAVRCTRGLFSARMPETWTRSCILGGKTSTRAPRRSRHGHLSMDRAVGAADLEGKYEKFTELSLEEASLVGVNRDLLWACFWLETLSATCRH